MIYLASPYSHPDRAVIEQRVHETQACAAELTAAGLLVISPILHWHHTAVNHKLPTDANFWHRWNMQVLVRCVEVQVLTLDGWETSVGVRNEIAMADQLRIPVFYRLPRNHQIHHP